MNDIADKAKVQSLTPNQAWDMLQSHPSAILVDVRSHMEFLFIGHPVGAVNIPWIDEPDWKINPRFAAEVRQLILGGLSHGQGDDVPVLLICRSGKRSLEAGEQLCVDGFRRVFNVLDGFEGELDDKHHRSSLAGWRHAGLPWEQC